MITPLWFSNTLEWIAQVAVLVLAAGLLPHIFKIRQPRVLLTYWRTARRRQPFASADATMA